MVASILLASCLLVGQTTDTKADPQKDNSKREITKLVKQLDGDTQAIRLAAKAKLLERGPAILEFLPPPEAIENAGTRAAVADIRQQLQKRQVEESTQGSTITLHAQGVKFSKVIADLQKLSGNAIAEMPRPEGSRGPDPEVNVDFDKQPFWPALDSVLDQARLSVDPYRQPNALQIIPRGPNDLPRVGRAVVSGPLRIEAVRVTARRDLRSSTASSLQLTMEVAWEPRLRPISVKQRMADTKISDASGAPIPLDDPEAEKEAFPRHGTSAVEMEIGLAMPPTTVKEIASIKGRFQAMLLGRVETFRFTDLLKGKQEKRIAGAKVSLDEFRKNGDTWEAFVRVHFDDAGNALESHRNWVLQNEVFLEDEKGTSIPYDSMETTSRTQDESGVGYIFALPAGQSPEKMTLVYKSPGMVITKDFPYELKGIKLP